LGEELNCQIVHLSFVSLSFLRYSLKLAEVLTMVLTWRCCILKSGTGTENQVMLESMHGNQVGLCVKCVCVCVCVCVHMCLLYKECDVSTLNGEYVTCITEHDQFNKMTKVIQFTGHKLTTPPCTVYLLLSSDKHVLMSFQNTSSQGIVHNWT